MPPPLPPSRTPRPYRSEGEEALARACHQRTSQVNFSLSQPNPEPPPPQPPPPPLRRMGSKYNITGAVLTETSGVLRDNAVNMRLHIIILDSVLTALSIAMATSWSTSILIFVEELVDASEALQALISSVIVTLVCVVAAIICAFILSPPASTTTPIKFLKKRKRAKRQSPVAEASSSDE